MRDLLDNVARYTPDGGEIWVSTAREGDAAVIRARDTGRGIPPELLPRVFEAFERGEHATGDAEGGLGLGLALARRLVEMHGGRIEAHSEGVGKGSEFVVRLPLAEGVQGSGFRSRKSRPRRCPRTSPLNPEP